MKSVVFIVAQMAFLCSHVLAADQFDGIKKRLADSECSAFKFISVLSSSVFETKDSTRGSAQIARDGRYSIVLGRDIYVCDGKAAYSYSPTTNQVIIERLDSGRTANREISFLTRLNDYYETHSVKANRQYRLTRKPGVRAGSIPDSMVVVIDAGRQQIVHIDYLDVNDEPVRIVLTEQKLNIRCDDSLFVPAFPDSAETVKL